MVKKEGGRANKVPVDRLKIYNEFLYMDDPVVQVAPEDPEALRHSDQEEEEEEDTPSVQSADVHSNRD